METARNWRPHDKEWREFNQTGQFYRYQTATRTTGSDIAAEVSSFGNVVHKTMTES